MQPIDTKKQVYDEARASLEEAQSQAQKIHEDLGKAQADLDAARRSLDMRSTRTARESVTDLQAMAEEVQKVVRERQGVAATAQSEYTTALAVLRRAEDEVALEALRVEGAKLAEGVFTAWRGLVGTLEDFAGLVQRATTIQPGARLEFLKLFDGVERTDADALDVSVFGPQCRPALTVGLAAHPLAPSDAFAILARRFAERQSGALAMSRHEVTLPAFRAGDAA